jgi:hypothetical protein
MKQLVTFLAADGTSFLSADDCARYELQQLQLVQSNVDWVTRERLSELTRYSIAGIDRKRQSGVWLEGEIWKRAPDNRILYSIKGYNEWAARVPA